MNFLPHLAPIPLAALVDPVADGLGESGSRTLVGTAVVLGVLALSIIIGSMMSRGKA